MTCLLQKKTYLRNSKIKYEWDLFLISRLLRFCTFLYCTKPQRWRWRRFTCTIRLHMHHVWRLVPYPKQIWFFFLLLFDFEFTFFLELPNLTACDDGKIWRRRRGKLFSLSWLHNLVTFIWAHWNSIWKRKYLFWHSL